MIKLFVNLSLLVSAAPALAQVTLPDYNWSVTDIAQKHIKREVLFTHMNRDFIDVGTSICSNRALMWVYDFKREHNIDAAKIFLFYTKKTGEVGRKTWWYHVAPVVNEADKLWVMDAGFPFSIRQPVTINDWLNFFVGSNRCKEIKAGENDLIERMFYGQVFPETTSYGTYDCYYKIAPAGYWTPASVAMNLLGVDSEGESVQLVRDEIDKDEVYSACLEATTSSLGRVLGSGKKKCKKYLDL